MKYALKIDENKRILSACIVLSNGDYHDMYLVDYLPDGDVSDYLYIGNQYTYNPLPKPEQPEPLPTQEERIAALEAQLLAAKILLGLEE